MARELTAIEAVEKYGSIRGAAMALGLARTTMQSRYKTELLAQAQAKKPPSFEPVHLPSKDLPIADLIARRLEESERNIDADEARDLIHVKVNMDGPFGLFFQGDPHVDDDGCDFRLLKSHIDIVKAHDHILVGCIGDLQNGWIGRLARLYGDQTTSARDAWRLVDWMVGEIRHRLLFMVLGNHDLWAGVGDPLQWMLKHAPGVMEAHGVRLALTHPCGAVTRVHARHNFPGTSIYNANHGPKREALMGFRDHIIVAGHLHIGADEGFVNPDGIVSQILRISGYKKADSYARQLGLKKMPIHPSALVIIDPRKPETSRDRVWCAPTVEMGVKVLDMLRAEYEAEKKPKAKKRA